MRATIPISLALGVASILASARNAQNAPGEIDAKSDGCLTCHRGIEPMHATASVRLGCTDCHGGNAQAATKEAAIVSKRSQRTAKYRIAKSKEYVTVVLRKP